MGEQILALNIGYLTSDKKDNELYTPYYATDHIIKYLPKDKIIWCPFDENWSAFYNRLKEEGYNVVRSSLAEGQDFFNYEPKKWDIIVSNPPFSIKDKVLERLYSFNKPFAVLLPLNSLQGKTKDISILKMVFRFLVLMQEFVITINIIWVQLLKVVHLQQHISVKIYYQRI